jgi:hypothetical protein
MDEDEKSLIDLKDEIKELKWRLTALEKEQRMIREDILSGRAKERMRNRLLNNPQVDYDEVRKKIDKQIKIKI